MSRVLLILASYAFAASAARAELPPPPTATVPAAITLVGATAGVPDPLGAFEVIVRDLAGNSRAQGMVVAVVQLARATQLKLTAECIATEAILSAAVRFGVDYGQGFRYRPATAARSGPAGTVAHAPARLARARLYPP